MAANRIKTARQEQDEAESSDLTLSPLRSYNIHKRHSRVTVKYNRKALQSRLDVEKWIDDSLNQLYSGQVRASFACSAGKASGFQNDECI